MNECGKQHVHKVAFGGRAEILNTQSWEFLFIDVVYLCMDGELDFVSLAQSVWNVHL